MLKQDCITKDSDIMNRIWEVISSMNKIKKKFKNTY